MKASRSMISSYLGNINFTKSKHARLHTRLFYFIRFVFMESIIVNKNGIQSNKPSKTKKKWNELKMNGISLCLLVGLVDGWNGAASLHSTASFIKKWMIHFFNYGVKGYRFVFQLSSCSLSFHPSFIKLLQFMPNWFQSTLIIPFQFIINNKRD